MGLMGTSQEAAAATGAAHRLGELWRLDRTDTETLTGLDLAPQAPVPEELTDEQRERVSLLLGIFAALETLYDSRLARTWIHIPNTNALFEGRTPLAAMKVDGLPLMRTVRQLLDARTQQ